MTVPLLHSNPTANLVIYLDFDGHTTTGTQWNADFNNGQAIVSPAFDLDGSPTTFNAAEQEFIRRVWQRVAEDFAPFNVDVTTQDPGLERLRKTGPGDAQWGVRSIQTADQSWLSDNLGGLVGGIAYVGSFAASADVPCFVFNGNGSDGVESERASADTHSHEVGHTLGLDHDGRTSPAESYYQGHGSGPTGWAPIMGASFNKELSQWSKGEYPAANNLEDDLFVITRDNVEGAPVGPFGESLSGLRYRADDHGPNAGSATVLSGGSSAVGTGIIERNVDVDTFAIDATAGVLTVNVEPAVRGANLDVLVRLYDALGQLVATSNPAGLLTTTVSTTVAAAARYYVTVEGIGKTAVAGDPGYSDYGSLGAYVLRATKIDPQDVIGYIPGANGGFRAGVSTGAAFNDVATAWPVVTWDAIRYGDFNGDGQTDVLGLLAGAWRVGLSSGGSFATQSVWGVWANIPWQNVTVGDLDGDGKDDILAREAGHWWAALSTGTAFAAPTLWATWSNIAWEDAFLADLTGDGKDDLLARTTTYSWWTGTSTGSAFGAASNFTTWSSAAWETPQIADMNGDGRADLVARLGHQWWVRLSSNASTATALWSTWSPAVAWAHGRTGDFDGNGFDDVLARDTGTGNWWVGLSNGSTIAKVQVYSPWSPAVAWADFTVGDYNGDGRDDLAGRTSGYWWVTLSTAEGTGRTPTVWAAWPDVAWQHVTAVSVRLPGTTAAGLPADGGGSGFADAAFAPPAAGDAEPALLLAAGREADEDGDAAPVWADAPDFAAHGELLLTLAEELLAA